MINRSNFMRAAEISRELSLSERTIRRWISDETLPSRKLGGARLVARGDLQRLLSTSLGVAAAPPNQQPSSTNNQ
jgi:excisionase family DNA binding protein